ncbi:hypothetical protein MKZ26_03510 [Sporosarcina sp. FSL K6-6792]|uniref:hypothetical protein n=1 Tax=Sporosarcina sp. FSL K6-6792 TaxID=2921559 RepID=UPI0030F58F8F
MEEGEKYEASKKGTKLFENTFRYHLFTFDSVSFDGIYYSNNFGRRHSVQIRGYLSLINFFAFSFYR